MNIFAFFGNIRLISVSIFIQVAGFTVTFLGEHTMKIFFCKCFGFFTLALSHLKIIPIFFGSLDEVLTL